MSTVRSPKLTWASPQAKQLLRSLATSSGPGLENSSVQNEIRLLYTAWVQQVAEVIHARPGATPRQYKSGMEKHSLLPALAAAAATQIK